MTQKQINLTLPENLRKKAETYANAYGFRNIQDLATEALREKVLFCNVEYDEDFTEDEIRLVDELLKRSLEKGKFRTEKDLRKALA